MRELISQSKRSRLSQRDALSVGTRQQSYLPYCMRRSRVSLQTKETLK